MGNTQTPTRRKFGGLLLTAGLLLGAVVITSNHPIGQPEPSATPTAVIDAAPGPDDNQVYTYDLEVLRVHAPSGISISYSIGAIPYVVPAKAQKRETTGNLWKRRITVINNELVVLTAAPNARGAHIPTHLQCRIKAVMSAHATFPLSEDPPGRATTNASETVSCSI
ncbi:MAG TPA: hypothetical protein VMT30_08350 [Candidatus Saccharimonadia bacterium]|nr:hypothetical protein [Candidatus Saccharimonadia bacterium]